MMWWIGEHTVLLDPAALVDGSYHVWQPNWDQVCHPTAELDQPDEAPDEPDLEPSPCVGTACIPNQGTAGTAQNTSVLQGCPCDEQPTDPAAQPSNSDAAAAPRKRRRHSAKKQAVSQEELDARHPGNARNRAAQQVVSLAWEQYQKWVHQQGLLQGVLAPFKEAASAADAASSDVPAGRTTQHTEPGNSTGAPGPGQRAPPIGLATALQRKSQVCAASDSLQEPNQGPSDWVQLYEMRRVLRPKIHLDHVAAQAASTQLGDAQSGVEDPDEAGLPGGSASSSTQQHDLFGSLISNELPVEVLGTAHEARVILPPHSAFLMTDLSMRNSLNPVLHSGQPFQCIVADPPWENASVKRSGSYRTLPSRNLLSLPVQQLLDQEQGVLLLWITNRERLHRFVQQELLPQWGLQHVATWYWLKVASGGAAPVSSLTSMHRHPFEHILVCAPSSSRAAGSHTADLAHKLPDNLVIMSVPSAEHSRKPHLGPLLHRLRAGEARSSDRCLELFAREMHAGWTSVGNEVLRFQDLSLFRRAAQV